MGLKEQTTEKSQELPRCGKMWAEIFFGYSHESYLGLVNYQTFAETCRKLIPISTPELLLLDYCAKYYLQSAI